MWSRSWSWYLQSWSRSWSWRIGIWDQPFMCLVDNVQTKQHVWWCLSRQQYIQRRSHAPHSLHPTWRTHQRSLYILHLCVVHCTCTSSWHLHRQTLLSRPSLAMTSSSPYIYSWAPCWLLRSSILHPIGENRQSWRHLHATPHDTHEWQRT